MSRRALSVLLTAATALLIPAAALAAPVSSASATAGVRFGDGASGGFIDMVVPVMTTEKGLGFINPRFSLEDHEENELNLGAGWRQLVFGDRVVLGGNLYFDSRYTEHNNRFNQFGAGLEVLSKWIDARANYYLPESTRELIAAGQTETVETAVATGIATREDYGDPYAAANGIDQDYTLTTLTTTTTTTTTTRRLFEQFESALEGFDAEIGALLPLPASYPALRLFAGYYSFEDAFDNRVQGPKGRLEMRIGSWLTLDAEVFDDDELNGTSYFAGARFDTPFDLAALFAGKNPFAGWNTPAPATLPSRMTEMVIRDPNVQTGESDFAENEAARKVEVAVDEQRSQKSSTQTYVLMDNVTFVDDGNTSGIEAGTAEHPYTAIQEGVDGRGANTTVYVFGGDYASVTLASGVTLWGEGTAVEGYGGKSFGGGAHPTISGASPAVTLTGSTRVTGFHITNTDSPGIYGEIAGGPVTIDNNAIEVAGSTSTATAHGIHLITGDAQVTISGNSIATVGGNGEGIALENSGSTVATIDGNTILTVGTGAGRGVAVVNSGGTLTLAVTGNAVSTDAVGLHVANAGSGSATVSVSGNTVSAGWTGMYFHNIGNSGTMTVTADGNTVAGGARGMDFQNYFGTMAASAAGNAVTTDGDGIEVASVGGGTYVALAGNTVNLKSTYGRGIRVIDLISDTTASLTGNTVNLDADHQGGIDLLSIASVSDMTASDNTVNVGTGTFTDAFVYGAIFSSVTLTASGNAVTGNAQTDMGLYNSVGTFTVNAAAPGASGDLSGLNNGMVILYSPDTAAFTFVP